MDDINLPVVIQGGRLDVDALGAEHPGLPHFRAAGFAFDIVFLYIF
jgi:hypothetical protein